MEGGENDHFGGTIWGSDVAPLRVTDSSPTLTVATSGKDVSFQRHKHGSRVPMAGSEVVSTGDSVGFHNEVPIANCSPTGNTAILPPIPTMGRCVSHNLWGPGGGGGNGGTTLAHRCGFDPGSSVVLPITTQTRPACPQVDSALGFTSVCARPVEQDRVCGDVSMAGGWLWEGIREDWSHYYYSGQNTSLCLDNYSP